MTKITNQLEAVATAAGALVAVGLLMLMVVMVEAGPAGATFPGKNGRIAYTSYDGPFPKGDYEIYTINPDGSGKTRLTNNDTDELDLSYSPDGKRIVYSGEDGPKGDLEIYTINARGGGKSRVTNNAFPYGLSWGIRP
jgi:dipeptidyl aminopeptidase/acylaminoacyl peptidase